MEYDFNTADAISAVFELIKLANSTVTEESSKAYVSWLKEELERLCRYLARQANAYADCAGQSMSGKEYGEAGVAAMTALGEEYSRLSGY